MVCLRQCGASRAGVTAESAEVVICFDTEEVAAIAEDPRRGYRSLEPGAGQCSPNEGWAVEVEVECCFWRQGPAAASSAGKPLERSVSHQFAVAAPIHPLRT